MINIVKIALTSIIIVLNIVGCNNFPSKISDYVINNCSFANSDTCYINLKDVFNVDYDTLFIVSSIENITGIRNISGCKTLEKNFRFSLDEDLKIFTLKKDGKVVYYDLCHICSAKLEIDLYSFKNIYDIGFFDGEETYSTGNFSADSIFLIKRNNSDSDFYTLYCRMEERNNKKKYIKKNAVHPYQKRTGDRVSEDDWIILE